MKFKIILIFLSTLSINGSELIPQADEDPASKTWVLKFENDKIVQYSKPIAPRTRLVASFSKKAKTYHAYIEELIRWPFMSCAWSLHHDSSDFRALEIEYTAQQENIDSDDGKKS